MRTFNPFGPRHCSRISCAALACGVASSLSAQPVIHELGTTVPGGYSASLSLNINGVFVAGAGGPSGEPMALRWNGAIGLIASPINLGLLSGGWSAVATGINADGSVACGYGSSSAGERCFRWTAAGGMQQIPLVSGAIDAFGLGIDLAGTSIAGFAGTPAGDRAFVWTTTEDMALLPLPPAALSAYGVAISGDGRTVVGFATESLRDRAFRWSAQDGTALLEPASLGGASYANAVNTDGTVIVGYGAAPQGTRALRWSDTGVIPLGIIAGCTASYAMAVSADGVHIAGYCNHPGNNTAFWWTPETGMLDLNVYLPTRGVDLTGWTLHQALAISADGSTIAGYGRHNGDFRGWVVTGLSGCGGAAVVADPTDTNVCRGSEPVLDITAVGSLPFTYQWRFMNTPIDAGMNPSAATASLHLPAIRLSDAGSYDCVVINGCGAATSAAATVTVCAADYNCSGDVSVQDIFDFLTGYFCNDAFADVNESGAVGVQDIFDFLAAYVLGC